MKKPHAHSGTGLPACIAVRAESQPAAGALPATAVLVTPGRQEAFGKGSHSGTCFHR